MAPEETIEYTKELTGFEDTVGKIEMKARPIPLPDQNPYESQQMEKVLSRVYECGTWLWKSTSTTGTKLAHIHFPNELFNKPNIKDKLKGFKYFRANVRVQIKLNSTLQHYGKLVVWYVPNCGLTNPNGAPYSCFRYPHVIVSAATQESAELQIPFISHNPWIHTRKTGTGEIGTLYAHVLHPLGSANSTTTQETYVTMFANFENISVAGTFPEDDSQSSISTVDHETIEKSERGILTNVAMTTADIASSISKFPIVGGIASAVAPVASTLGNLFDYFGLEKPTSVESYVPNVPQVGLGYAQGRGLDLSKKFTMDLSNKSTTNLNDQPVEDTMSLKKFMLRPSLFKLGSFDRTYEAGSEVTSFYVTPITTIPHSGELSHTTIPYDIARCFAYWRGSMKYKFLFTCSKFTTARVRISWSPENEPLPANYDGDVVSKVVDIMGDTEVSFTVPYLDNLHMMTTQSRFASVNGQIMITVLNRPVGGDDLQSTKIYFAGFIACGEDFELYQYVGIPKNEIYQPDVDSQSSMISDFSKIFDPLIPASFVKFEQPMISEKFTSFKDVLLIPWFVDSDMGGYEKVDANFYEDVHPFMYLHRFHRGSLRVKTIVETPGVVTAELRSSYKGDKYNGPINVWYTKDNPIVEFELPYYSNCAFKAGHSGHRTPNSVRISDVYADVYFPSGNCSHYRSVGDDYIGFFPQWPGFLVDLTYEGKNIQGGNLPSTKIK